MKKAISVLLLVCMVSALCSAGAYATDDTLTIQNSNITLDVNQKNTDATSKSQSVGSVTATGFVGSSAKSWTWTSNDKKVATVDSNGNVTAVGQGTTTCSVVVVDANDKTWTGTVNVTVKDSTLDSASISNEKSSLSVSALTKDGSSATINTYAWASDNTNVILTSPAAATTTYSSTDTSVAQTANITVKVTDSFNSEVTSAAYTVTIPAASVPVESITVNPSTTTVAPGGTVHMTATVKPDNATNRDVKWSVSGNATIDESTGLVTVNSNAASGDTITVTATAQDGSNVFGTGTLTVGDVKVTKINITSGNSVTVNGQLVLTAEVEPSNASNKDITWTSTDSDYVTVSGNIVTGKKEGTATITATAKDGSGVFASYKISVVPVAVESVSLNKSSTSIPAGSSETLIATVNPSTATDKTVTWTSSDVSVATVDSNGKVTAVKEGTAKITATAGGKSATCDVTVTKAASVRIDVSSNLVNNTITARGSNMVLYANVYKDNQLITSSSVNWSITYSTSSNGLIKLTDYGYNNNAWTALVTGNFNGDYTITASCVVDNVTYSKDISVKVAYAPSIVAGNYSVWNGRDALSFLVNDHISNWSGNVWIDGILVSNTYYTCIGSSDGEIWLTLSPSLLNMVNQNNPKNSTHTLTIGDTRAAAATGYFRTWGTASSFNGVKTGDDANLGLWAALLAVSAVGAGAAVIIVKRRKTNNG